MTKELQEFKERCLRLNCKGIRCEDCLLNNLKGFCERNKFQDIVRERFKPKPKLCTELKTLKDLTNYPLISGRICEPNILKAGKHFEKGIGCSKEDLRQEAIKEIKMLENIESSGLSERDKSFLISIFDYKTIKYIKWKNNITEEDLK